MNAARPCFRPLFAPLIFGVVILASCNLAPKFARPELATPAAYKESTPAPMPGVAWTSAHPRDDGPRGPWWEIYHDTALNQIEERVGISSQTIAAAAANFRAARAAATAARSALFPTITTSPSVDRLRNSSNWTSASNAGIIENEYALPVTASYEIDLWGQVGNSAAASAFAAQASAADLATAVLSTQAQLAQDYFAVRALDAEKRILDDTVAAYRESLSAVQTLERNGIDSAQDVAQAQNQLDTTVAQDTDLEVARALYEHAIAVLIGQSPANFSLPAAPFDARPPVVPPGVPSDLLERRPDIAAAERRVAAANAEIGVARAAYFPSLILGATGGWEATNAAQWFDWPSRFWSLGPELGATLFDWGARRAVTEQAKASFDKASADYRQAVLNAFAAVEDNLAALRILQHEADEERVAVESSRRLLQLVTSRYHLGIDSYLDVAKAQTGYLSSQTTALQIQLRQMTASVALVVALGGGWDASRLPSPNRVAKLHD